MKVADSLHSYSLKRKFSLLVIITCLMLVPHSGDFSADAPTPTPI